MRSFRLTVTLVVVVLLAGCQWVENMRCRCAARDDDCCETTCCDDGCCPPDCRCATAPSSTGTPAAPAPKSPTSPRLPRRRRKRRQRRSQLPQRCRRSFRNRLAESLLRNAPTIRPGRRRLNAPIETSHVWTPSPDSKAQAAGRTDLGLFPPQLRVTFSLGNQRDQRATGFPASR